MSDYHVVTLPTAEADVETLFQDKAERSETNALRFLAEFAGLIERLEQAPRATPIAYEDRFFDETIRDAYFGKPKRRRHRALTLIRDDAVYILRVRAPGQDWLTAEELRLP